MTTESERSTTQTQPVEVRNNSEESRFDILVGGVSAGFSMYTHHDEGPSRQRIFYHTVIDEQFDGRGLASVLTRTALRTSVQEGYRLVAVCPYVARWLTTHRDVDDAVDRVRPAHLAAVRRAAQGPADRSSTYRP